MSDAPEEVRALAEAFRDCQKTLLALGDENRQHLILTLLYGNCNGLRIGDIAAKTNLSRPAASHHIKVLREAGLVNMRREGTKNFYYFNADTQSIPKLLQLLLRASALIEQLPHPCSDTDVNTEQEEQLWN